MDPVNTPEQLQLLVERAAHIRAGALDPIWGGGPTVYGTATCQEDEDGFCIECAGYGAGVLNGLPIFGLHFPSCSSADPRTIDNLELAVRRSGYGWPGGTMTLELEFEEEHSS